MAAQKRTNAAPVDVARSVVNANDLLRKVIEDANLRLESSSLQQIGVPIVDNPLARNEFLTDFFNKILLQELVDHQFNNPLSVLKGAKLSPFGDTYERYHINPAKAIEYRNTDDNILTAVKPDVAVEYIKVNREDKYPVSIELAALQQAFMTDDGFNEFRSGIIGSLYSGDYMDEYRLMLRCITDMIDSNYIPTMPVSTAVSNTKTIINVSDYFRFPSSSYNAYTVLHPDRPRTVFCNAEDVVVLGTIPFINDIKVDVLSAAFNLSQIELKDNIIKIDTFSNPKVKAVIMDRSFLQVRDQLQEIGKFERADNLTEKTYLHHWQVISSCLFANALAIVEE